MTYEKKSNYYADLVKSEGYRVKTIDHQTAKFIAAALIDISRTIIDERAYLEALMRECFSAQFEDFFYKHLSSKTEKLQKFAYVYHKTLSHLSVLKTEHNHNTMEGILFILSKIIKQSKNDDDKHIYDTLLGSKSMEMLLTRCNMVTEGKEAEGEPPFKDYENDIDLLNAILSRFFTKTNLKESNMSPPQIKFYNSILSAIGEYYKTQKVLDNSKAQDWYNEVVKNLTKNENKI